MNQNQKVRRDLLKILGSIPLGLTVSCSPKPPDSVDAVPPATNNSTVGVLVRSLGHWPDSDAAQAAAFTDRLITSPGGEHYTGDGASLVTAIARKLGDAATQRSIELAAFTVDERELLLRFVQQFFSYLEIRNQISGEPVFGECQADPLFYTRLT